MSHRVKLWMVFVPAVAILAVAVGCDSSSEPGPLPPTTTPLVQPHPTAAPQTADEAAAACMQYPLPAELTVRRVPPWDPGNTFRELVDATVELYRQQGQDYRFGWQDYSSIGDYLNYGTLDGYEDDPQLVFDARGVPMVRYDGGVIGYNPVTTAQYALVLYGRSLRDPAVKDQFLLMVDALIESQDDDGRFPSLFPFPYYRTVEVLGEGWAGALGQGQALSALRRAYDITGETRYRDAGDAALRFLLSPAVSGGNRESLDRLDSSLARLAWFEEYPTREPQYTLNGFMFTLLGLYDWSGVEGATGQELATTYFRCGLGTLEYVLPFFDLGGISTYDLGHIVEGGAPNVQVERHDIHIYLLHALASVVDAPFLTDWEQRWIDYIED